MDGIAELNEAKIRLLKENALLKRQLEAANAAANGAQKSKPPAAAAPHSSVNPKVTTPSATNSKLEAEVTSLRKEVATMKRLLAASQDEHKRQIEALVTEAIEHEERYRQLIVTMDAKLSARDKRIAELKAEVAAAAAAGSSVRGTKHTTEPSSLNSSAAQNQPQNDAQLRAQMEALQEIMRIAQGAGCKLVSSLSSPTDAVGSKRSRGAGAAQPQPPRSDSGHTVLAPEVLTDVASTSDADALGTALLSSHLGQQHHSSYPAATATATAMFAAEQKRRGRPPGKASPANATTAAASRANNAALALRQAQDVQAATTRAVMATVASSSSTVGSGSKDSGSAAAADFGPRPIEGYLRLLASAERGLEESRLAAQLEAHYRRDMNKLGADLAAHVSSSCGPIATAEGTRGAVLAVVAGIRLIPDAVEAFLRAAWAKGLSAMALEACHINHSNQLYSLGYAMRLLADDAADSASRSLSASSHSRSTDTDLEGQAASVLWLCVIDFLCAYLHVRNRERGQADESFALPQLLSFLMGVLPPAPGGPSCPAAALQPRPLPEMVAHCLLHDVMRLAEAEAEAEAEGSTAAGLRQGPSTASCAAQYHALCRSAGWLGLTVLSPSVAMRGLLAKLRVLTALAAAPSRCGDEQQLLIVSLRPLLLYNGYDSVGTVLEALSAGSNPAAASSSSSSSAQTAPSALSCWSRQALMQLVGTAVIDFNISSASDDWATFSSLFASFLEPSAELSAAHVCVCVAVLNAYSAAGAGICDARQRLANEEDIVRAAEGYLAAHKAALAAGGRGKACSTIAVLVINQMMQLRNAQLSHAS